MKLFGKKYYYLYLILFFINIIKKIELNSNVTWEGNFKDIVYFILDIIHIDNFINIF